MLAHQSTITPHGSSCSRRRAPLAAKTSRGSLRVYATSNSSTTTTTTTTAIPNVQLKPSKQDSPAHTAIPGHTPDDYGAIYRNDLDQTYVASAVKATQNLPSMTIKVPRFGSKGSLDYPPQAAPVLNKAAIQQIKSAAINAQSSSFKQRFKGLRSVDASTGFNHPGGIASAAELALLQERLQTEKSNDTGATIAEAACHRLITGTNVPPKKWATNKRDPNWHPPVDTPVTGYEGPFPMESVCIRYSGLDPDADFVKAHPGVKLPVPPKNYPSGAPLGIVGHMSFVELDSQMAIKQAMAYWAETDAAKANQHAQNAFKIIDAWVTTNKGWKPDGYDRGENGPLEAGWGIAAMARALEMLRTVTPGPNIAPKLNDRFVNWVKAYGLKQMTWFTDTITPIAIKHGSIATYGNWHATIAEAMMSVAILSNDRAMYKKAVDLFNTTVKEYVWKWGRVEGSDPYRNRHIGEITETLRDMYHPQFGIGGMLQCAEIAWQQDDDLYSSNEYALVAAMELHARLLRAGMLNDQTMVPPDYVLPDAKDAPNLPAQYKKYKYDTEQQAWVSPDATKKPLRDGKKYLQGIQFLPCGWEIGYNHYAGRLGIPMPETAALLKMFWPEWQVFHWGLGTLTHAGTAAHLWTPGVGKIQPS